MQKDVAIGVCYRYPVLCDERLVCLEIVIELRYQGDDIVRLVRNRVVLIGCPIVRSASDAQNSRVLCSVKRIT